MKLSLWILKDWLEEFSPVIQCKNNRIEVAGIRLYQPGMAMDDPALLYLGPSNLFYQDGGTHIVCQNQEDSLSLQTDDLFAAANRILDAFSFYGKWYHQCTHGISKGCSLSEMLDYAAEVFSAPIIIVNAAQILVAQTSDLTSVVAPEDWNDVMEYRSIPVEKLKQFNQRYKDSFYNTGIIVIPAGFFPTKSYCKQIFVNEERLATLIVKAPEKDFTTGALQLLELFAPLVREWIQSNQKNAHAFRLTSNFTHTLDGSPGSLSALLRQLSLFGWKDDCRKQVFVICSPSGQICFDVRLIQRLANESLGIYAVIYQGNLVILCNLDIMEHTNFIQSLCRLMAENSYSGAISFCFTGLEQLAKSYRQTLTALEHSPQAAGKIYRCQDVAMRMVGKIVDEYTTASLLHPALSAIRAHDQKFKTNYYDTLFSFLRNERRHQQTAEELFIHRNTLFLRLEKIQELWPLNLNDTEERFYLLFSFYQDQYAMES